MTKEQELIELIINFINENGGAENALKIVQSTPAPHKMRRGKKLMMKYIRRYIHHQRKIDDREDVKRRIISLLVKALQECQVLLSLEIEPNYNEKQKAVCSPTKATDYLK